ncbi:unnamed protein product [Pedinophyceae sp. YPF-701]|nr:unnamed protein product [Pedinophyceae sp. YPF-701]
MEVGPCPGCGAEDVARDNVTGVIACTACGLVLDEEHFAPEGAAGEGAGCARGGIVVRGEGPSQYSNKAAWRRRPRGASAQDRAQRALWRLSNTLQLPPGASQAAIAYHCEHVEKQPSANTWVHAAACCYLAAAQDSLPVTLADAADAARTGKRKFARVCRRVAAALDIQSPYRDPAVHLARVVRELTSASGPQQRAQVRPVVEWLMAFATHHAMLATGRSPLAVAAACGTVACRSLNIPATPADAAAAMPVAASTVAVREREILECLLEAAQVLPWGRDLTVSTVLDDLPAIMAAVDAGAGPGGDSSDGEGAGDAGLPPAVRRERRAQRDAASAVQDATEGLEGGRRAGKRRARGALLAARLELDGEGQEDIVAAVARGGRGELAATFGGRGARTRRARGRRDDEPG